MQSFERLKEVSSYITIMDPMDHPAFAELYADLKEGAQELHARAGRPANIFEGRMWIFIASPRAITPFHFDRYSNVLM